MHQLNMLKYYTMYFWDSRNNKSPNIKKHRFSNNDIYILCIALLAKSALLHGISLTLITNNKKHILDVLNKYKSPPIEIIEIPFKSHFPDSIRYYQAHQKLEVIRAFGTGDFGKFPVLIDSDCIFLKKPNFNIETNSPMYFYELPKFSEGHPKDIVDLLGLNSDQYQNIPWYGGEWLAGPPELYAEISSYCDQLRSKYLDGLDRWGHIGDEFLISSAAYLLQKKNPALLCTLASGVITRYWSCRTNYPTTPLMDVIDSSIFHLPSDKIYLAQYYLDGKDIYLFHYNYKKYIYRKILARFPLHYLQNTFKIGKKSYLPKV